MKNEKLDNNFEDVIAEKIMLNMHRYFQKCGILAIAEDFGKPLKYTLQYFAENKSSKYITYDGLEVVVLTSDGVLLKIRINIKTLSDGVEISYSELKPEVE